jgi:hypothetical protein
MDWKLELIVVPFFSFSDPDGTGWLVQEVGREHPV